MRQPHRREFLCQSTSLALCAAGGLNAESADPKPGADRLRIVTLEGTPRERGLTHGKTLKEPIHALLKLWKADLAGRYKMEADAFIPKFLRYTDYVPAMKQWTPELLEEIRGIAQGADVDFDTMLVFQLVDEYWVNGPGAAGEHCSAMGFSRQGERPAYVAQNMDLEGFRDGFQTVLRIKHADMRETLVLTNAGLIGLNGVSCRSLGVCCNTLTQLANCKDGLPVACVVRGVLEQPHEEAAIDFLRKVKHASGQNYIFGGGANKVYSFECSARKVARFTPPGGADVVWHTNHPLVNDDYTPQYREQLKEKKNATPGNSEVRLQSVEKRLRAEGAVKDLDLIRATLVAKDSAEHPVCRPHKGIKDNFTFASTIMVLSAKPEFHVAPGPPDVQRYQTLKFFER